MFSKTVKQVLVGLGGAWSRFRTCPNLALLHDAAQGGLISASSPAGPFTPPSLQKEGQMCQGRHAGAEQGRLSPRAKATF